MAVSRRGLRFVVLTLGGMAVFIALWAALGLHINFSNSYPVGIWRFSSSAAPTRGDYVVFRFPEDNHLYPLAVERQYLRRQGSGYAPLMKRLAALPGDAVAVNGSVSINGAAWPHGEVGTTDSSGRPVPRVEGTSVVPEGFCWVLSDYNSRSFDSRYFGPIPIAAIYATARPVLIFPDSR